MPQRVASEDDVRNGTPALAVAVLMAIALGPEARADEVGKEAEKPRTPEEIRQAILDYADRLLDARTARQVITRSFEAISDNPDPTAVEKLASSFEAVFSQLESVLTRLPGTEPARRGKVRAYLFGDVRQYMALDRAVRGSRAWETSGMYFPSLGVLSFHSDVFSSAVAKEVMIHECTHAYVDYRVRGGDHRLPDILEEGFAEYVGNSEVRYGSIRFGSYAKETRHNNPVAKRILDSSAARALKEVRATVRVRKDLLSFERMFAVKASDLGKDAVPEFYGAGWLLVDFLRHGDPAWKTKTFPTFMARVAAGDPAIPTMVELYGQSADELERRFREYVKAFKLPVDREGSAAP
jgi:hypothetical protein